MTSMASTKSEVCICRLLQVDGEAATCNHPKSAYLLIPWRDFVVLQKAKSEAAIVFLLSETISAIQLSVRPPPTSSQGHMYIVADLRKVKPAQFDIFAAAVEIHLHLEKHIGSRFSPTQLPAIRRVYLTLLHNPIQSSEVDNDGTLLKSCQHRVVIEVTSESAGALLGDLMGNLLTDHQTDVLWWDPACTEGTSLPPKVVDPRARFPRATNRMTMIPPGPSKPSTSRSIGSSIAPEGRAIEMLPPPIPSRTLRNLPVHPSHQPDPTQTSTRGLPGGLPSMLVQPPHSGGPPPVPTWVPPMHSAQHSGLQPPGLTSVNPGSAGLPLIWPIPYGLPIGPEAWVRLARSYSLLPPGMLVTPQWVQAVVGEGASSRCYLAQNPLGIENPEIAAAHSTIPTILPSNIPLRPTYSGPTQHATLTPLSYKSHQDAPPQATLQFPQSHMQVKPPARMTEVHGPSQGGTTSRQARNKPKVDPVPSQSMEVPDKIPGGKQAKSTSIMVPKDGLARGREGPMFSYAPPYTNGFVKGAALTSNVPPPAARHETWPSWSSKQASTEGPWSDLKPPLPHQPQPGTQHNVTTSSRDEHATGSFSEKTDKGKGKGLALPYPEPVETAKRQRLEESNVRDGCTAAPPHPCPPEGSGMGKAYPKGQLAKSLLSDSFASPHGSSSGANTRPREELVVPDSKSTKTGTTSKRGRSPKDDAGPGPSKKAKPMVAPEVSVQAVPEDIEVIDLTGDD